MVVGIRDEAEQAAIALTLEPPADCPQSERQAEVTALEQSLAKARREIGVLQRARESDARTEVSITTALARLEALQEEKITLASEVAKLRGQLVASESAQTSGQVKINALQGEKAALAAEVAKLRDQLVASEIARASEQAKINALQGEKAALAAEVVELRSQRRNSEGALASEQAKVKALQKDKTALSGQSAKLRQELAISERKLKAVYKSISWRITRPLRSFKLPPKWK
ncbi:hypothetical protein [Sinorhizobium fredii]|uniref:hypothetical protein n=1 Tax=Rhizobium fredii TaxID=380 RepID=UPI00339472C6